MEMDSDIENTENHSDLPPPVIFNCWKHHLGYIRRQIQNYTQKGLTAFGSIVPYLLLIGNSQTDLYTGNLDEVDISSQILIDLDNLGLIHEEEYNKWIDTAPQNYRLVKLSDGSIWTLRKGLRPGRFIHIHPGRHTLNSTRIRANTLKTAILVIIISKLKFTSPLDLAVINDIRVKILGLAPIKSVERSKGIIELVNLIKYESKL